jgi:hypothetical protein
MNQLSGYIEIEMGGEILPFKFGTNCWALFCEMQKIEFSEISKVFDNNFIALRDLFYCAHIAAIRSKGETVKLNKESFGDLLDETEGALPKLQEVMVTAKIMGYTLTELGDIADTKKK